MLAFGAEVRRLATYGLTIFQIAAFLRVPVTLINRYYEPEVEKGELEAHSKVAARILADALYTKGSVGLDAAKFWMKNRANWNDRQDVNLKALIGVVDVRDTPREQLSAEIGKLGRLLNFARAEGVSGDVIAGEVDSSSRTTD